MSGLPFAYPFWRFAAFRPLHRLLPGPPRHSSGIPTSASSTSAVSVPAPVDRIRQANFDLLFESLEIDGNPSRVWANYINLLTYLGYERLPLEIHQQVLRKCAPPSRQLRASIFRRLSAGNFPRTPHIYEGRFQAVIRNMRASGGQPTLDDYNFILEQFAAVGHHFGAMQVYTELTAVGLIPRTKTFGLCLQAIAHRLTFPVTDTDKPRRIAVTRRMVSDLVNAMKSLNIPFTSVNLDLTMRILKETTDMQSFETLMKWGYGIDLANPDCPPLEYITSSSAPDTQATAQRPTPQPFSTAALNMTIDTLGRLKDIPRMVQTFEVLTTPLPKQTVSSFDEDDDDFGEPSPASTFIPPSAPPNTTTYNILLRHISRAGHTVFARHYLLQALRLDIEVILKLKNHIGNMPLQEVPAPHFAINRGTLLSVLGLSNRDKNRGLMWWLNSKFHRLLKRKRGELKFYTRYRAVRQQKRKWPYEEPSTDAIPQLPLFPKKRATRPAERPRNRQPAQRSRDQPSGAATVMERWTPPKDLDNVFDLDIEEESISTFPPTKTFNLDLHISVLERDIREIESLYDHVQIMVDKMTRRVQDRLARRIFRGKNIYLLTEWRRRRISMERWEEIRRSAQSKRGEMAERIVFPWTDLANRQSTETSPEENETRG